MNQQEHSDSPIDLGEPEFPNHTSLGEPDLFVSNTTTIVVDIIETQSKSDSIGKYIIYVIRGCDRNGGFEVSRRFNDFFAFRCSMVTRWPGCFIPPIPPKQAVGNHDVGFIQVRMKFLQNFLRQLSLSNALWYSDEVNTFLRSDSPDLERYFYNLQRQTNDEIIRKYEANFKELSGKEINLELINSIQKFQQFLNRVAPMLINFKEIYKNLQKARESHNDQYMTFVTYMLPEYERTCLLEYSSDADERKQVFSDMNSEELRGLLEKLKHFFARNEFNTLLEAVRLEAREIDAFNEAIAQKDQYEMQRLSAVHKLKQLQLEMQELIAGKTTLKSIFSSTPKEEQLAKIQIKIDVQNKDIEQLQFLCDIITVILGHVEIVRFRKEKESQYFKLIKQIAEFELEFNKISVLYWEYILKNKYVFLSEKND